MTVTVRFVGSGDSFGSGGRFQTCILVDGPGIRFAMDFGTTSLVALRQQGIEPNSIDVILLTHLHGDHCGWHAIVERGYAAVVVSWANPAAGFKLDGEVMPAERPRRPVGADTWAILEMLGYPADEIATLRTDGVE